MIGMATPQHSFAVCAYRQSPYLEECIRSVIDQSHPGSEIFISTSTPSEWLNDIAEKYNLPVYVNTGETGIGQDWNFAYSKASGDFITIAHQDDFYCRDYVKNALRLLESSRNPLIFFCNYGELREGSWVSEAKILNAKRKMLRLLANGRFSGSVFIRRRILSLGSPICCPSVTFSRESFPSPPFKTEMTCSLDWDTWESISTKRGDFLYDPSVLMYHRIHAESATTELIENNVRTQEDLEMYKRFWPDFIAGILIKWYAESQKSNNL